MAAPSLSSLLEREAFLASLRDTLDESRAGRGQLVLVAGEAGVGKTALVRAFTADADTPVLAGACDSLFAPRPLAPVADVAAQVGGELEELVERGAPAYEVLTVLLSELRRTPAVLVLEDLHWADEATLDLVRLLARRIHGTRSLVVGTYRDDELGPTHPLRIVVGAIVAEDRVSRLRLPPLSAEAVDRLAEPHGVDGAELFRRTGGNAFFVTEALAASTEDVPATVRDAVLARAAGLPDEARAVLEAVAIAPPRAELWLVEVLCQATDSLDDCLASGMLVHDGDCVAFRHELARLAIDGAIGAARKRKLHLAALRALEEHGADHSRLVHHADAAGDKAAVLRFAPLAGERAASVGAHRQAAAHYERALAAADGAPLDVQAALFERCSIECYLVTANEAALAACRRALDCYRTLGDERKQADVLRWLSRLHWINGRFAEGEQAGRAAVELLERLPQGRELALAYVNLAGMYMLAEDHELAASWATRGLELARRIGDVEATVAALITSGGSAFLHGRADNANKLEEARALAEKTGLAEYVGRAYLYLAWGANRRRRIRVARAYIDSGLEFCEERDLDVSGRLLLAMRSWTELEAGDWTTAAETATQVLAQNCPFSCLQARVTRGLVGARRGEPDPWTPLAAAADAAADSGLLVWTSQTTAARAEAAWLEGRLESVEAEIESAYALAVRHGASWPAGELAFWRSRCTGEDAAPPSAAEPFAAQIRGDWAAAAASWRDLGCPYEEALALAEADDDDALKRALELLRRLGAGPATAMVAQRLRERGIRVERGPRTTTLENPAGLTRRELEVLGLVAGGLRNTEIAARLFLADRTVEHHVSAILRKLGVQTRTQASVEASRLGLVGEPQGSPTRESGVPRLPAAPG
jgi:DNA-binding CsgD family transcriptional regulator